MYFLLLSAKKAIFTNKKGQVLIEVLFSLGVIVVCLSALTAAVTLAIRNTRLSKEYSLATKYAEEGIEEVRIRRDQAESWSYFLTTYTCGGTSSCETCEEERGIFRRCFTYELNGDGSRLKVIVSVDWSEGGKNHRLETTTFLSRWER
ncbi:MAG: hypothetical protein NC935_07300 [Candidatus Omnitrophica bacterium]|nr:hypothetical protein [Candidatus Omnitrophota bacterium]